MRKTAIVCTNNRKNWLYQMQQYTIWVRIVDFSRELQIAMKQRPKTARNTQRMVFRRIYISGEGKYHDQSNLPTKILL